MALEEKDKLQELLDANPYIKGAYKKAQEKGASDFEEASTAEGGMSASMNLLKQLRELSSMEVSTGEREGLISGAIKGKGFSRPYKTEPLGTDKALQLLRLISSQGRQEQASLEEARRVGAEERRTRQERFDNFQESGGKISEGQFDAFRQEFNYDPEIVAMTYGLPYQTNKETGERSVVIPSQKILDNRAAAQIITPKEIEYFDTIIDARQTMQEVVSGLADLGIAEENFTKAFNVKSENVNSPLGPLSIPARFDLAGQYAKDPKYTALKSKLERAFQKYRKVITGAQASQKELNMLRPLITSFTQRPGVFFENARTLINENDRMLDTRLALMEGVGRNTTKIRSKIDNIINPVETGSSSASSENSDDEYNRYLQIIGG